MDEIKKKSDSANFIKNKSDELLAKYRKIVTDMEEKLKAEKEKISNIENDEEYKKLALEFDEKYEKFKRFVQKLRANFYESVKIAENEWSKITNSVIAKIAKEEQYSLILNKGSTVFLEQPLNLTDKIIVRLNQEDIQIKLYEIENVKFEVY